MRENPEFSDQVIDLLASSLAMSRDEVLARMQKPWGLLEAMKGKWPNYGLEKDRTEIEDRLLAALEIVQLAEKLGHKDPGWVRKQLKKMVLDREWGQPG